MNLRYTIIAALFVHGLGALYVWATYSPVRPILECVEETDQGWVAHLGWLATGDEALTLAPGDNNQFILDGKDVVDVGQPQTFQVGRSPKYPKTPFRVKFDQSVTWELGSHEVTATRESRTCEMPEEQKAVPEMPPIAKVIEPPPPKEEPPPPKEEEPPPPKEEPPPPKEEPKAEPKKKEPPAPKKATVRKKGQPKKKKKPKKDDTPPPTKAEPVPVTLTNVNMTGGVNVQKGESDNFGDPSVKATKSNTNQEQGEKTQDGGGEPGGTGTGPATPAKKKPPVIKSPKVVYSPKAKWPSQAPMLGRVVTVRLSLKVGKDGKVNSVKVVKGAGGAFNSAAIALAKRIKFKPGTRDGKPIALPVPWTVVFQPAQ